MIKAFDGFSVYETKNIWKAAWIFVIKIIEPFLLIIPKRFCESIIMKKEQLTNSFTMELNKSIKVIFYKQ